MKVSLVAPLVSLPFFVACSPAVQNVELLKNVNQKKGTEHSFTAKKKGEEPKAPKLEKVSAPSRLARRTITKSKGYTEAGVPLAAVVYNSELVPIIEEKEKRRRTSVGEEKEKLISFSTESPSSKYRKNRKNRKRRLVKTIPVTVGGTGSVEKEPENVPPFYSPVQSEQELKEELTALKATGDWSDSGEGTYELLSSYGIQCELPKPIAPVKITLDLEYLASVANGKKNPGDTEQQEVLEHQKTQELQAYKEQGEQEKQKKSAIFL
ncbi:MAG: hypothetical protein D3909_01780 [Candidatus Electrothrix sp. ATG1]|nr:hypothetical protein [Candidatus Electrothrix sp. ATG1]